MLPAFCREKARFDGELSKKVKSDRVVRLGWWDKISRGSSQHDKVFSDGILMHRRILKNNRSHPLKSMNRRFTFALLLLLILPESLWAERYVQKLKISPLLTAVISEGEFEARSTGSFSIHLYSNTAEHREEETTFFTGAIVCPRDGVIEKVKLIDLDRDQNPEIVVIVRSVGSGGYLSGYAFRIHQSSPVTFSSVSDLPSDADVIKELVKK